jgi:hypothetical protein
MKEEWLFPGAAVPVDVDTTAALVAEIKRLIGIVGGMALDKQLATLHDSLSLASNPSAIQAKRKGGDYDRYEGNT